MEGRRNGTLHDNRSDAKITFFLSGEKQNKIECNSIEDEDGGKKYVCCLLESKIVMLSLRSGVSSKYLTTARVDVAKIIVSNKEDVIFFCFYAIEDWGRSDIDCIATAPGYFTIRHKK